MVPEPATSFWEIAIGLTISEHTGIAGYEVSAVDEHALSTIAATPTTKNPSFLTVHY